MMGMDLNTYYKRKRRKAALLKLAGVFLSLLFAGAIIWGFSFLFNDSAFKHILQTYGLASPEIKPGEQPKAPPWLIFCLPDDCFYIDENGVLSESAPRFSENPLPELAIDGERSIKIGERLMEDAAIVFIKIFLDNLKSAGAEPARIEIADHGAKIILKEGWHILISFDTSADEAASNLKLLLDQKIKEVRNGLEYIDLRFPNKAFYKLR